jgi:hypothetical protein
MTEQFARSPEDTDEQDLARRDDDRDVAAGSEHDEHGPLMGAEDAMRFQDRWEQIQTGFVDDPRSVVKQADELVAELMQQLAEGFAAERRRLEGQWDAGDDVSTEDLRLALQRYRSFFRRLLTT